jgi:5'-methylthioadenosine phosphorylase
VGAGAAVRWLAFNLRSFAMAVNVACIGGRAAYDLVRKGVFSAERLGPRATPYGESQPLYRCRSKGGDFLLLCRHGEAGYEVTPNLINYRANIYALRDLDVVSVVSWSETRAISHNYKVGQFVVVDDLIDETISRPTTFFANKELGHIRHWPVFCPNLRKAFVTALEELKLDYSDRGVYVCIEGPRQETPAEAHKYEVFGGELIGQTLAPEVFLAKELQMAYASLCFVASYAETGTPYPAFEAGRVLSEDVLARRADQAVQNMPRILERVFEVLGRKPASIEGRELLRDSDRNGNWRKWFESPRTPTAAENT